MTQQNGYGGFSPATYGAPVPPLDAPVATPAGAPPLLRPLSTGEILDRTFVLYRKRFWLFAGIGLLPAAILTLSAIVRMIYSATTHHAEIIRPGDPVGAVAHSMSALTMLEIYLLPATILFLVAYGISHAATVDAVANLTRGVEMTALSAYQNVRGRWLRWTGIILRQFWSAAWPSAPIIALMFALIALPAVRKNPALVGAIFLFCWLLIIGTIVWGVLNYLRNALAIPASVQENLGVNASLRRSRTLVAGRKGRIFLALLMVYALQMVAGGIQVPLLLLASTTRGLQYILLQSTEILVQFVSVTLVAPIASISLSLFYIDERVRREGYDIEVLMQRSFAAAPVQEEV